MIRFSIALATLSGLLLATGCIGQPTEFSRSGLYAGASVIGAMPNFDDVDGIDLDDDDLETGIGLRAGFRFLDHFAVELAYERYADFEMDVEDVEMESIVATGKWYPLTGRFQPYGLIGVGVLSTEISGVDFDEDDAVGRLGFGLEAYLLEKLPFFAEFDYRIPGGDSDELQYSTLQLGALFRF